MKKTKLFEIKGMFAAVMTKIQVYDTFAVISFSDSSVVLAIRPEIEGGYVLYNEVPTKVGDSRRTHVSSAN